jgi:ribosomal protein S18 acetylase RimI-like enzyme
MRVRSATLRDYEAMCVLFNELDELHRQARPEMFQPFAGPVRTREQVAHRLSDAGSTILVAEGARDVVGLAVLLTRPASGFAGAVPRRVIELDNLVVRADRRGRRIGRRLLAAGVEWARERKATHVEVAVHSFNRDARRFYEGFGFKASIDRLMIAA